MSNWNYPQWIMLFIILWEFVGGCLRMAKPKEKLIEDVIFRKEHAELILFIHTIMNIIEVWILAKGGFWG